MELIDYIHNIDIEIVNEINKICEKNNIKYFMLGGTFLGAIRHNGFIPWDDDMDFGMFRNDYEKFIEVAQNELPSNMILVNYKTDKNYHYYITRIQDINTNIKEERLNDNSKNTHISIDIFPLDGVPNNYFLKKVFCFRIMFHRALMSMCYKESIDKKRKRNAIEKLLIMFLSILPINLVTNAYKEKEKIDRIMKKQNVENSLFVANLMGAYRTKEIYRKDYFINVKKYKFENLELLGPIDYDSFLSELYGDYMKLPPIEERKVHYSV